MKALLLRAAGVTLSFLLGLALVEAGLRVVGPGGSRFANTAVGERARSGTKVPDFRGRREPGPKEPGTFRILAVGDSFAWGVGVHADDAYPYRLELRLNRLQSELGFEVVNWSRSGWNTHQAWLSLRNRLDALEPDLLIVNFVLNDAEPDSRLERERMYEPLGRRSPAVALSRTLHRHSLLYRLLWERLENSRQRQALTDYYLSLFEGPDWEQCVSSLEGFRDAARRLGIPVILMVFPVFDSQLDERYVYSDLHERIGRLARQLEIPALDLLATFSDVDARRLAVTPFTDPHPNELAHRIAADRLLLYLMDEELLPATYPPEVRRRPKAR